MGTTTQQFKATDVLKMEVGVAPAGVLPNRILNPDGAQGAWGWQTPPAGANGGTTSAMSGSFYPTSLIGDVLLFTVPTGIPTGVDAWAHSDPAPAAPGSWHSGRFALREAMAASRTGFLAVQFHDSTGAIIAVGAETTIPAGTAINTVHATAATQAPALTAYVSLRIGVRAATTGQRRLMFNLAQLVSSTTSAAVTGIAYSPPYVYTDVLPKAQELLIKRAGGLALGTLTTSIRDSTLDPSANALLRPKNPIRVLARTYDGGGTAIGWEPLFCGFIKRAPVRYDMAYPDATKRTLIQVTAVDASATLANIPQPSTVATISELRYVMESTGVPFIIDGSGNQKAGAAVEVARIDKASVADQIGLTRDGRRGHAWINRFGAMSAEDPANVPSLVRATLAEADYNQDILIDYDTGRIINAVTVKTLTMDAVNLDFIGRPSLVETVYGPYVDQASIDTWGAFSEEFTVPAASITSPSSFAASILAANATPGLAVQSLTLPILEAADLKGNEQTGGTEVNKRAHLDLYDRVTVTNTQAALNQTLRIAEITHSITPTKWLMGLTFASTAAVAMPSPTPAGESPPMLNTWTASTLSPGFSNIGGHPAAGVRALPGGMVASQGLVAAAGTPLAANLPIVTIPPGFRPTNIQRAAVQCVSSGGGDPAGIVEILPSGVVRLTNGPATAGNVLALSLMFTYPLY